jgi:hypothetical protein
MTAPTSTLDPIGNSNVWHTFQLKGVTSPGFIPKGGVKGFARKVGWDEKKGKGTQGATLTLTGAPPVKGSFKLQLFTPEHFAAWDAFVSNVLAIDPTLQASSGLSIFYPALSSIGLTTVVVESYTAPEHKGKGLYEVEVSLIEWQSPPPVNVTSTPDSTAPDDGDPTTTPQQDPRVAALQAQIAALTKAANAP